jgi:dienelactone hydrolase
MSVSLLHVFERFCMGGRTALEVARTGELLSGAVSFHGGLNTENVEDGKNIKVHAPRYRRDV